MNGYPRLYIGKAAQELKKRVSISIQSITTETLQDFIDYYSMYDTSKNPIIVEDLAYLRVEDQSYLLKFIEDSPLKIILLSSEDNIIPTILSRMSLVYKLKESVKSLFNTPTQAQEELNSIDADTYYLTYVKKEMELSPICYYYDQLVYNKPNKSKLIQIISD